MKSGVLLAACAATAAFALGRAASAAETWNGYHVGVSAGYAFGDAAANNPGFYMPGGGIAPFSAKMHLSGAAAGVDGGRDWQSGNVVFGLAAGANYVGAHGAASGEETRTHFLGDLRGRLGYASGPWLVYGAGGASLAEGDTTGANAISSWNLGWNAGGGLERRFGDGLSARVEYSYTSVRLSGGGADDQVHLDRLTVGVSKRF